MSNARHAVVVTTRPETSGALSQAEDFQHPSNGWSTIDLQ